MDKDLKDAARRRKAKKQEDTDTVEAVDVRETESSDLYAPILKQATNDLSEEVDEKVNQFINGAINENTGKESQATPVNKEPKYMIGFLCKSDTMEDIIIATRTPVKFYIPEYVVGRSLYNIEYVKNAIFRNNICIYNCTNNNDDPSYYFNTIIKHLKKNKYINTDIRILMTPVNDSYLNVNELFNHLKSQLYETFKIRNVYIDADAYFGKNNKFIERSPNVYSSMSFSVLPSGQAYHVKLGNYPSKYKWEDYGEGTVLSCVSCSPGGITFERTNRNLLGDLITKKLTLSVADIINYNIEICRMYTEQSVAESIIDAFNAVLESGDPYQKAAAEYVEKLKQGRCNNNNIWWLDDNETLDPSNYTDILISRTDG